MVKLLFVRLGEDQSKCGSRDNAYALRVWLALFGSTQTPTQQAEVVQETGKGGGGDQPPPDFPSATL